MSNNIVKFPNDYVPPEQETLSDLKKNIKKNKEIYVNIDESVDLIDTEELSDDQQMSLDFGKKDDE